MAKRLNDTAAIVNEPGGNLEHSVSVRRIDNGFLISKRTYNEGTGLSYHSEEFSKNAPQIGMPKVKKDAAGYSEGSLSAAVGMLRTKSGI